MNLRKTLIKLTLGYLVMIMLVSVLLSVIVYAGGARPLDRRVELGQRLFMEEDIRPMMPPDEFRPRLNPYVANEVKRRLALSLLYFNIGVFCIAGLLSYTLAKRELKPLEEAMELQSRFTSDAAHELRTPLTAMKAEIEVALRGAPLEDAETRELLESNLEEIDRLDALSSSLLKLAQYEEGEPAVAGSVYLTEALNESLEKVKHLAEASGVRTALDTEQLEVQADRAGIVEMMVILLENSIKYSDANTVVMVTARRQKRFAAVTVSDQGYGIEEADLAHVFDRFYRGTIPAAKGQVPGHGLGLSIARRIAERNQGSIEIQSEPGRGTTVTVSLPLAR